MCDILRNNFDRVLPQVEEKIKEAKFIGVLRDDTCYVLCDPDHYMAMSLLMLMLAGIYLVGSY